MSRLDPRHPCAAEVDPWPVLDVVPTNCRVADIVPGRPPERVQPDPEAPKPKPPGPPSIPRPPAGAPGVPRPHRSIGQILDDILRERP